MSDPNSNPQFNPTASDQQNPPPFITAMDVRLFLLDRNPSDNFLLDDLEFSQPDIESAMQLMIDKFNSLLPLISYHTKETFIWRYQGVIGTAAILLRMRAINYSRNRLDYGDNSGTSVQDKNKSAEYLAMAAALMAEFEQQCIAIKRAINTENCYGAVMSRYSTLRRA